MSGIGPIGEVRGERFRILALVMLAVVISSAIAYSVAAITVTSPPGPAQMRAEIVAAFRELAGRPKSSVVLTPYVQGMDAAMAEALATGATNPAGQGTSFLADGTSHVSSIHQVGNTVVSVNFAVAGSELEGPDLVSFPFDYRFVGSAILVGGQWKVTWVTVCMLIEQEGALCPNPPAGVDAPALLPYSLSESGQLAKNTPDLAYPAALAIAHNGNLLIVDASREQILRWQPDGTLSVFAGDGRTGFTGDGGPAVDAELNLQTNDGIAVAANGTVYIPDPGNCRLRAVGPNGIIRVVADNVALCNLQDVAVSPTGGIYVATGQYVEKVASDGVVTKVAGASGPISSDQNDLTPSSIVFTPEDLAFDGAGNLDIWSFEPRAMFRLTPQGAITALGAEYATQITSSPSGTVLVAGYRGGIGRVTATGTALYNPLLASKITGLGWSGKFAAFQADGIAVTSSGVVYVDNFMGNGAGNGTALVAIEPNGSTHVVPVRTPLLDTLPKAGAPRFPTSIYPATIPGRGRSLSACPSMQGLQTFTPAATAAAKVIATGFNTSFSNNLVNSDRSWWQGAFEQLQGGGNRGQHTVTSVQAASKDSFSAIVADACGDNLLQDSIVVDIGGSGYSSEVSHLYFLDRHGHPLVYFQAS